MTTSNLVLDLLTATGAIMKGHFLLTSGRHSDIYLEKFRLLERPTVVEQVGQLMADAYSKEHVDIVLGAAVGGILLSHATGKILGTKGIFAERVDGKLTLKRGFELPEGKRVLIVEDVVTTGKSVLELVDLVQQSGATLVGLVCLVDRSASGMDPGYPFRALLRYPSQSWEPHSCPLCRDGVPLETRGRTGKA